jgi:hypothetical protein
LTRGSASSVTIASYTADRACAVEAAILDHDGSRDMSSTFDLFPRQTGGRVADLAGLLRRVLQPVAGFAVLLHEPPF